MRTLLSCLALAMLAGIIGCGEPAAPEKPATPAENAPAENEDGDKSASAATTGEMQDVSLSVPKMT